MVEKSTRVEDLDMKTASPPKVAASGVVPRVSMPGRMRAVKIEPKMGETPFYAKLRAEVTQDVLQTGSGTMYLGFHLDPLYHVHWNNLAEPIRYELKTSAGMTVSPSVGMGPKVDVESDIDPREFLAGRLVGPMEMGLVGVGVVLLVVGVLEAVGVLEVVKVLEAVGGLVLMKAQK